MVSAAQQSMIDSALIPARVASEIDTAIAAKTLKMARQQGAALVEMIDGADQPATTAGDPLVAKATGLGQNLDIMA